jgi:outer membrane protein
MSCSVDEEREVGAKGQRSGRFRFGCLPPAPHFLGPRTRPIRARFASVVPMTFWIAVVVPAGVAPFAAAQEIRIGYVDLQRALNECDAGKKAKEEFKRQVDRLQGDLEKQKQQLESLKEQLEKKALVMKEEERRNLENDYRKRLRDFERSYKDSQGELQMKDNELTGDILRELQKVIQAYGQREGYTLILENSSATVLYSSQDADLTDRVIEQFNRDYRGKR